MKRIVTLLAVALTAFAAAGCRQAADTAGPGITADDMRLEIAGAAYRCNMDIDTVIAALGDGFAYAEGQSCDYEGLDKSYLYEVAQFYTNPLAEGDLINEIYTESPDVSTSKGIAVGASREDVLAAYGDDCEDEGDLLIYRPPGERVSLCFELENGAVWAIYLTTQSV